MENTNVIGDKIDLESITRSFKIENKEIFALYLKDIWIVKTNNKLSIIGFISKKQCKHQHGNIKNNFCFLL